MANKLDELHGVPSVTAFVFVFTQRPEVSLFRNDHKPQEPRGEFCTSETLNMDLLCACLAGQTLQIHRNT